MGRLRFLSADHATHAVYGSMIVLAIITSLDAASATARECVVAIVGLAVAVGLSQLFSDLIGGTYRAGRMLEGSELAHIAANVAFGFGAALVPAVFFVLALAGTISLHHALTIAEWTGIGVIWIYVFAAARAAGLTLVRSVAWALALTVCGIGLVELKLLAHPGGH
jgi:hypothetical protein